MKEVIKQAIKAELIRAYREDEEGAYIWRDDENTVWLDGRIDLDKLTEAVEKALTEHFSGK